MKRGLFLLVALLGATLFGAPSVSTTMDFLDIVMGHPSCAEKGYLTVEAYEEALAALAAAGITRVNLRVNGLGAVYYDSKVTRKYGYEYGYHVSYPKEAGYVIETINRWDPLAETIRLCHKHGMEAWCWENLYDDCGSGYIVMEQSSMAKFGLYPLMDDVYRHHPEYLAMPRPGRHAPSEEVIRQRNAAVEGKTIGRIVACSDAERDVPCRIRPEELRLAVSDDNLNWRPYNNGTMKVEVRAEGKRTVIVFSDLQIKAKYVKIYGTKPWPRNGEYCFALFAPHGNGKAVYDTDGNELPAYWCALWSDQCPAERQVLNLLGDVSSAFDYGQRGIGFMLGEPGPARLNYVRGMPEMTIPAVMKYRLERFAEYAAYPFDGYVFISRTHSFVLKDPDEWGFNPEVREKYLKRYGQDIWAPDFKDTKKLQALRAEALDEYLAGCKRLVGKRPLYVTIPQVDGGTYAPGHTRGQTSWDPWGSFPYNWEKWVENGTVDGIGMIGWCNPAYFRAARAKHPFGLLVFVKVKTLLKLTPEETAAHLRDLRGVSELDNIELYESCLLPDAKEHLKAIRSAVDDATPVSGGEAGALQRIDAQRLKSKWD